jgi:hypothetical protein
MKDHSALSRERWKMTRKKVLVVLGFAFIGWALCAATMGVGMAATSLSNALVIHAVAAPLFFAGISLVYFWRFGYTTPLQTAGLFLAFVVAMDFFVVALLVQRSLEMFASPLGTWIPFASIFASTWLTGALVAKVRVRESGKPLPGNRPG